VSFFLSLTLWLAFNYPNSTKSINTEFPVSTLMILLGILAIFSASTLWPLYKLKYAPLRVPVPDIRASEELYRKGFEVEEGESSEDVMRRILASESGYKAFQSFCLSIFQVEACLFLQGLKQLEREMSSSMAMNNRNIVSAAMELYSRYLAENASLRVPVEAESDEASAEIDRQLTELESHISDAEVDAGKVVTELFGESKQNCFQWLLDECYPLFLKSGEYQELTKSVEEVRRETQILEELNLEEKDAVQ